MSLEDKHLEHLAAIQAVSDYSWHSWNSPVGLALFFLVSTGALAVLAFAYFILRAATVLH